MYLMFMFRVCAFFLSFVTLSVFYVLVFGVLCMVYVPLFSSAITEMLTEALRGNLKINFSRHKSLSVFRPFTCRSDKIGKFFPRKTAQAQIEGRIQKPLGKLHKDLCHCTESRLYGCTKLSKLATTATHFSKEVFKCATHQRICSASA